MFSNHALMVPRAGAAERAESNQNLCHHGVYISSQEKQTISNEMFIWNGNKCYGEKWCRVERIREVGRVLIFYIGWSQKNSLPVMSEQRFERRELSLVVIWKKSVHWDLSLKLLLSIHCPLLPFLIEPLAFYVGTWPLKIKIRFCNFPWCCVCLCDWVICALSDCALKSRDMLSPSLSPHLTSWDGTQQTRW